MTVQYRVPELSSFNWQKNVSNTATVPTGTEVRGTRYRIIATATGIFAGLEGSIATANDPDDTPTLLTDWIIDTPTEGWICWDATANKYYVATSATVWIAFDPATAHTQNTDTGTTSATFQLDSGNSGPKLKNNGGLTEVKNAADNAYADLKVADLQATNIQDADGANGTTPAQLKTAYDSRASYDAELGCLTFNL